MTDKWMSVSELRQYEDEEGRPLLIPVTLYFTGVDVDDATVGIPHISADSAIREANSLVYTHLNVYEVQAHFNVDDVRPYEPDVCDECGAINGHWKGCPES